MTSEVHLDRLREIGARDDTDIDLADTALILAALDRPEALIDDYRDHLVGLVTETGQAISGTATPGDQAAALRAVVFENHDYAGDTETYDDVRNANLMSVIDRRRGLPVALGILCIHAARAQGWAIAGINFPSHFMLRLGSADDGVVIDPFYGGDVMDEPAMERRLKDMHGPDTRLSPGYLRPVCNRDILLRLQNNIKLRALRGQDLERALAVVERMVILAPDEDGLQMEMAIMRAETGQVKAAIDALEKLRQRGGGVEGHAITGLLQELKGKLN